MSGSDVVATILFLMVMGAALILAVRLLIQTGNEAHQAEAASLTPSRMLTNIRPVEPRPYDQDAEAQP